MTGSVLTYSRRLGTRGRNFPRLRGAILLLSACVAAEAAAGTYRCEFGSFNPLDGADLKLGSCTLDTSGTNRCSLQVSADLKATCLAFDLGPNDQLTCVFEGPLAATNFELIASAPDLLRQLSAKPGFQAGGDASSKQVNDFLRVGTMEETDALFYDVSCYKTG